METLVQSTQTEVESLNLKVDSGFASNPPAPNTFGAVGLRLQPLPTNKHLNIFTYKINVYPYL
jgi:hypothetical protein